jgi:hypothetical protein
MMKFSHSWKYCNLGIPIHRSVQSHLNVQSHLTIGTSMALIAAALNEVLSIALSSFNLAFL